MIATKIFPLVALLFSAAFAKSLCGQEWRFHTIDSSSRGADGVRLGDVNKDGRLDIATGWEEGGRIRICFQPPTGEVRKLWPSVEVGKVKSPEDAAFADVNGDGWLDVVSCCEGKEQSVFFHLNPGEDSRALRSSDWKTERLQPTQGKTRWMFCQPLDDARLVLGSKNPNAQISIWHLRTNRLQIIRKAGWIMSLRRFDIDNDKDLDIVYSDRKGDLRSVGWLEQRDDGSWKDHMIGVKDLEAMFLDISGIDGKIVIACNTRNQHIQLLTPGNDVHQEWKVRHIAHPTGSGAGKAVAIGDIDQDGRFDVVCTCGLAKDSYGAYWLSEAEQMDFSQPEKAGTEPEHWVFHDISGTTSGEKFDRIELIDIDSDGDLDLLTCEERDNLGVLWYENPSR